MGISGYPRVMRETICDCATPLQSPKAILKAAREPRHLDFKRAAGEEKLATLMDAYGLSLPEQPDCSRET